MTWREEVRRYDRLRLEAWANIWGDICSTQRSVTHHRREALLVMFVSRSANGPTLNYCERQITCGKSNPQIPCPCAHRNRGFQLYRQGRIIDDSRSHEGRRFTVMDPVQAGFCHEPPKPYPSSAPSPSTLPRLSPATHFKPRIRFSAFFPALNLLKDALPYRGRDTIQQSLQPRTQIKVLVKNHSQVSTDNVMHPNKDPFSRARIPYLECSPPRKVKASIIDLAKKWDDVQIKR